jgi:hypothetical protein
VRAHGHRRAVRGLGAGPPPHHVARRVHAHVVQPEGGEAPGHPRRALALLARRGGDLGELGLRAQGGVVARPEAPAGVGERAVGLGGGGAHGGA